MPSLPKRPRKPPARALPTPAPRKVALALLVLLSLVTAGCATHLEEPTLDRLAAGPKVPVVLVPGVTGSLLAKRDGGEVVWGTGPRVLSPRDGGYALARPLSEPLGGPTALEARSVIERMQVLGVVEKEIYGPIPEMLERHGYVRGNFDSPGAGQDLYLFPYDWRDDNVMSARRLGAALEALAQTRGGDDDVQVDLICQSNGAHICRYLLKYGAVPLEEAERRVAEGGPPPRRRFSIRKLLLVGTSNGGSLRILRELHRGRQYLAPFGRRIEPEVMFTFPALYQDLPAYRPRPFLDTSGQPLDLSLFDPEVWVREGWSIFEDDARLRADQHPEIFGDKAARRGFLARSLDRSRRLHALLSQDAPGFGTPRYYLLQNGYDDTPHRAIRGEGGGRGLLFTGDDALADDPYLEALATAPGDGHATLESQLALSPQERGALAAEPFLVRGEHFELILDPGTRRQLLEYLAAE
ncbi:MAG: hypothetical protein AAGD06_17290 [Acidobacteriota bacterium]